MKLIKRRLLEIQVSCKTYTSALDTRDGMISVSELMYEYHVQRRNWHDDRGLINMLRIGWL